MELKVYYQNIEIELPLVRQENNIEDMVDELGAEFKQLIDNIKVLKYFGLTFRDGK